MSQHALTIANQSRSAARLDIQDALQALGSASKGPTAPSTAYAGQLWLDDDTPSATRWTLKQYDGTDWIVVAYIDTVANTWVPASAMPISAARGHIAGWTYANGADATNDIDIAAGWGIDTTGAASIEGAAMTKQLDASWVAGNGNGGRSGTLADGDWYVHAVLNVSAQLVDYIFSQSLASPTLPGGYTLFRPIAWFKRASGVILGFTTCELPGGGLKFLWRSPTLDVDITNGLTTARRLDVIKVPLGLSVVADVSIYMANPSSGFFARVMSPLEADGAPSLSAAPLCNFVGATDSPVGAVDYRLVTNASGEIAARSAAITINVYRVQTNSFEWSRRA